MMTTLETFLQQYAHLGVFVISGHEKACRLRDVSELSRHENVAY